MNDKKDMPFPIVMANFKNNMIETINQSGLPMCVVREIIGNLYNELDTKAQIELKQAQTITG